MVFLLVNLYVPNKVPQPVLNYSNVAEIYPDYIPLDLMYNEVDLFGNPTSELVGSIIEEQGSGSLVDLAQKKWDYQGSDKSLKEIILEVSDGLENENRGAYFVVDTGATSGLTKVVIYGSVNNMASFMTFGNLVLQQLIR